MNILTPDTANGDPIACAMAKAMRGLAESAHISRAEIRAAVPDLTDAEFDDVWTGERSLYLEEFALINERFSESRLRDNAFAETMFAATKPTPAA